MAGWYVLLFFFVVIGTGRCSSCRCDDPDIGNAQICESLFSLFEDALLSNESNTYKLRNLLYPSTTAPPELANITYHLQFTTTTGGSAELPSSSSELPSCLCPGGPSDRTLLNTSGIMTLRYGWTMIAIYNFIHPAILNQLQVQLPFKIMRLVVTDDIPFLWNGHINQLPSTSLHLTISTDNLTCLPGHSEVDGVLKRLTSYVSGSQGACILCHLSYHIAENQFADTNFRESLKFLSERNFRVSFFFK